MSLSDLSEKSPTGELKAVKSITNWRDLFMMIVVLFKMRIVFLLLMAATGGAFLAAGGWPGLGKMALIWLTGGMAASGASSLNQYLERKSDGNMGRTKKRPLVNGDIPNPNWVPWVGIALIILPSAAVFPTNPALAFFLLLGAFIYVVIYTIWLKPRTLLNIVIGGAAGSAAVLSGSAAVGHWNDPGALVLALILFLWTPFHFWSLALLYRDDYSRADVPMLPTKTTPHQAAWWVMSHTIPAGLAGLLLVILPSLGWVYFAPMLLVTADLFWRNVKLIKDPSPPHARSLFMASNIYLTVLLLIIFIDSVQPFLKGV
ncbi:MAG: protoheme IX farnesyltransferase [Ardenticatenaceae bacterium]|nr:protoheme IX farnesyltransferase [Ardenticatenaceae bacterium]MCB9444931.1 protoheme IX farnesyltransferase [Ardenticatenaceae bacterium]